MSSSCKGKRLMHCNLGMMEHSSHFPGWIMQCINHLNYSPDWTLTFGFIKEVFSKEVIAYTIPLINSQKMYSRDGAKLSS